MSEQPEYPGAGYVPQQTSGLAVASLVLSILGLTQLLPFIGSPLGLVLGYMGRNEIRASGGAIGGDGLATAGIAMGWVGIGLALFGILIILLVTAGMITLPFLGGCGIPIGIGICGGLGNVY